MPRSRPIVILQSILAGVTALLGGAALGNFVDVQIVGLANLVVAAVTVGLGVYLSVSNVPAQTVLATQEYSGGDVVAGPASTVTTGAVLSTRETVDSLTSERVTPTTG